MNISLMEAVMMFADHLIEIMGVVLAGALLFRLLASQASRRDQIYFKTFARAVEKTLDADESLKTVDVHNVEQWVVTLMNKVTSQLPGRSLRFGKNTDRQALLTPTTDKTLDGQAPDNQFRFREKENFADFAEGKKSIVHGIRAHVDVLKSAYPPNFGELALRILDQDKQWKTVGGVPTDIVSRMLDILPGLFVIGGILGTFIGISSALPKIGAIDMNKIVESAPILSSFIDSVALSMRTSIAGISYSLAMTILNTIFPVNTQRSDVKKSVQRCLEILWNRIHGNKLSHGEARVISLLEKIAGESASGVAVAADEKKAA